MNCICLGYHDVVESGAADEMTVRNCPARYTVERSAFRSHLEQFRDAGVNVNPAPRASTLADRPGVILTFDDGALGSYTCAAPELERVGWRGHFFVTTDWIGRAGFMNRAQIRELHDRGHVIGTHTCTHPARMSALPIDVLMREWAESCAILADITGQPILTGSVADGYYARRVGETAAVAGLQVLFNSEPTAAISAVGDCLILGRYSIQAHTPTAQAVQLALGSRSPRLRQAVEWQGKKLIKAVGGRHYLTLRKLLLNRRTSDDAIAV